MVNSTVNIPRALSIPFPYWEGIYNTLLSNRLYSDGGITASASDWLLASSTRQYTRFPRA